MGGKKISLCFLSQHQVTLLRSKVVYVPHCKFLDKLTTCELMRQIRLIRQSVCPSVCLISDMGAEEEGQRLPSMDSLSKSKFEKGTLYILLNTKNYIF
jgi:hypothetical protein